jgi:signal transduction histidine kinase
MRGIALARAAPFRYALAFAGLSMLAMGILLAVIYWSVTSLLERHLEVAIEQQLLTLRNDFEHDGRDAVLGLVSKYLANGGDTLLHYLVQDRSGKMLGGDLQPLTTSAAWLDLEVAPAGAAGKVRKFRARGEWFDQNTFLLVAHDTVELAEIRDLILRAFGLTLAATIAISLAGGLSIGSALLRRVEGASGAARAIMDGDLSQRIPVTGNGDELDRLAQDLNRMLGRIEELMESVYHVTSDVAHDLRTPLGRLRQRLEAAQIKTRTTPEYQEVINTAIGDTDALLKTFEAMLRIAQIEAGATRARFATVDLSGVAKNVIEAYLPVAEDHGKQFTTDVEPNTSVRGDRELLTQLLASLVENTIRHTPPGSTASIGLHRRGDSTFLIVGDDGPGIPIDERERVLRRFYRLDASRSAPGSGLGLSLVAAIAKLHGAVISLEDNAPGLRVTLRFDREAGRVEASKGRATGCNGGTTAKTSPGVSNRAAFGVATIPQAEKFKG